MDIEFGLCRQFLIDEILAATNNFDDSLVLGQGGFATVYRGDIDNGTRTVAIKKSKSMSPELRKEFHDEILMVSKFRHSHLVSLFGYCETDNEMILVYEYMASGTLDDNLHKLTNDRIPLCWVERLKISIGVARALDYLHTGTGINNKVIHRDIKSSNILLDQNRAVAKISDFGFSKIGPANQADTRVMTRVIGTFGYMDPDYYQTCVLTSKSDVYAFGVVLFEMLCGRRAVDVTLDQDQRNLAKWAQLCVKKGKVDQIIDSNLKSEVMPRSLSVFVKVANKCLNERPKERPTMTEVLVELVLALSLQETGRPNGSKITEKFLEFFSVKPRPVSGNIRTYHVTEAAQKLAPKTHLASEPDENADIRTALYDFEALADNELYLTVGERVVFEYEVKGWFHVKKIRPGWDGKIYGWVPGNHLSEYSGGPKENESSNVPNHHASEVAEKDMEVVPETRVSEPYDKASLPDDDEVHVRTALYDFEAYDADEVSLTAGDRVEIGYEVDDWFYVKKRMPGLDGKIYGWDPANHLSFWSIIFGN